MKTNKKSCEGDIPRIRRDALTVAIVLIFGMPDDTADIMTHVEFYVNRFRGFGVLTPPPNSCYLWSLLQQCKNCRATQYRIV